MDVMTQEQNVEMAPKLQHLLTRAKSDSLMYGIHNKEETMAPSAKVQGVDTTSWNTASFTTDKVDVSSWKTSSVWGSFQPAPVDQDALSTSAESESPVLSVQDVPLPQMQYVLPAPMPQMQYVLQPVQVAYQLPSLLEVQAAFGPNNLIFSPQYAKYQPAPPEPAAAELEAHAQELARQAAYIGAAAEEARGLALEEKRQRAKKPSKSKGNHGDQGKTTVMFRNIPNNYSREMLLELLDAQGFKAKYDFFYWPMDFHKSAGLGYAFINLISEDEAIRFKNHFSGFTEWSLASHKVAEVGWSEPLQGYQPHVDRYKNSPVMHDDVPESHRPLLFSNGELIKFPPPTKQIRPPRMKKT